MDNVKECRICMQDFYNMDGEICYSCEVSLDMDEPEDFSGMSDNEIICALIGHEEQVEECTDGTHVALCLRCGHVWTMVSGESNA